MAEKDNKKVSGFDSTVKEIRGLVKGSKVTEKQIKTGSSFFEGSDRFCKLVKTADDLIYLELNVKLDNKVLDKILAKSDYKTYSRIEAAQKHLGSLHHIVKSRAIDEIKTVLNLAWKEFRSSHDKKEEPKQETKQELPKEEPKAEPVQSEEQVKQEVIIEGKKDSTDEQKAEAEQKLLNMVTK